MKMIKYGIAALMLAITATACHSRTDSSSTSTTDTTMAPAATNTTVDSSGNNATVGGGGTGAGMADTAAMADTTMRR